MLESTTTISLEVEEQELLNETLSEYAQALQKEINLSERPEIKELLERRLHTTGRILYKLTHIAPQGEYA